MGPRLAATCTFALVALATASAAVDQVTSERSELVSLECAMIKGDDGRGEAPGACAMTCAKRGDPMGVMTADEIFLVVGDYSDHHNAKLLDFVAKRVEARGTLGEKDGRRTIRIAAMKVLAD